MYNLDVGIELVSKKILLFDPIQNSFAFIAKDESHFLNYLRWYLEYTIMPDTLKSSDDIRTMFREKIIKAVGGDEYSNYYTFIFPSEEYLNEHRILQFPFKF